MARASEQNIDKGISFPFRFGSSGGVKTSKLTHYDYSRIKESLHQIVLTFQKERIMNAEWGSTLRDNLFDIVGDETSMALMQHEMSKAIEKHEPRVLINDLKVFTVSDSDSTIMIEANVHIIKFVKDVDMQFGVTLPAELIGGM